MVNAHLWSDGCAGQFKNKDQFYWLTTGFQAYGIRLVPRAQLFPVVPR